MDAIIESLVRYAKSAKNAAINATQESGVKIYYVGGIVRDMLLELPVKDIDIVVEGDAIEFCKGLKDAEILSTHPDFGTCKVRFQNKEIDFASTREEYYPQSGCLPVVQNIGCSLHQDVLRRDFTINAIALDLETGEIIDYLGGVKDLHAGVLKILHPKSFIDDPTRILRALDFELRFNFKLVDKIKFSKTREGLSFARVDLTLKKLFSGPKPFEAYEKIIERKLYKIFQDEAPKIASTHIHEAIKKFGADSCDFYFRAVKNELPKLLEAKTNYEIYKVLKSSLRVKHIAPLITGDDLIALGISEGPKIGEILEKILEIKLNSPQIAPKTPEEELKFALKITTLQ